MNTNEVNVIINQISQLNDQLWGAPGAALAGIFVAVLCLTLKWWHMFPDDQIPRWTTFVGVGAFFLLAPPRGSLSLQLYIGKNLIFGFVMSAIISMVVLRFGSKLPYIGQFITDDEPKTETKDETKPNS